MVESGQTVGRVCLVEEGPDDQTEVVTVGEDGGPAQVFQVSACQVSAGSEDRKAKLLNILNWGGQTLTGEQQQQLKALVAEWDDVFAVETADRGEVKEITHDIDTGNNPPVKQFPRRVPFALRSELQKLVGEMLASGVIEESNSPWASPVILVRKKDSSYRRDENNFLKAT